MYRLNDGDKAILKKVQETNDPTWATNYYLRSKGSGTWWRPVGVEVQQLTIPAFIQAAEKWKKGYDQLHDVWTKLGKPRYFHPDPVSGWIVLNEPQFNQKREALDRIYRAVEEPGGITAFHHPHGVILLPYQLEMWRSTQSLQVVIGGYGSAKTWGKLLTMMVRAILLPGYRAFCFAPYADQANEVWKQAKRMMRGTEYEKRFLLHSPKRPYPHLVIGHDQVGENFIECKPLGDDPEKVLTTTGDEALVDQAEQFEDLELVVRATTSRLRGLDPETGRPLLGQVSLIANSNDNPQLWDFFDEGMDEKNHQYIKSFQVFTSHNTTLPIKNLIDFERNVGKDDASRRVHLLGERPMGAGQQFSAATLEKTRARWLDDLISQEITKGTPGYDRKTAQRVDIYHLETPPDPNGTYFVAADPGWGNPPDRNSAAIGVFRIDNWPEAPATMVAFSWVFSHGNPNAWLNQYQQFCLQYKAISSNAYDATGFQSGYDKLPIGLAEYFPQKVNMNGNKKWAYVNLLRKMMADGLFALPYISHMFHQLGKYAVPEPAGLKQDLVMMLVVAAAFLEPKYTAWIGDRNPPEETTDYYDPDDRYIRDYEDRYGERAV